MDPLIEVPSGWGNYRMTGTHVLCFSPRTNSRTNQWIWEGRRLCQAQCVRKLIKSYDAESKINFTLFEPCSVIHLYKRSQGMHNFIIKYLIQLYFLRHVSNNQVFISRKTCTCSFTVLTVWRRIFFFKF